MRYLSIDIESTGLNQDDLIIEFAMIPFCTERKDFEHSLARHFYVQCPPYETLLPRLDPWVANHNEKLIRKANQEGISLSKFKAAMEAYVICDEVIEYFNKDEKNKIVLFGKSLNAIDLPFLNRDLGWTFLRQHFHHQVLDLSGVSRALTDIKILPSDCVSGSGLMRYLGMGDVAHTAMEDAVNTAKMYLSMMERLVTNK